MGGRGRGPRAGLLPKDDAETQEESLYWGKVVNELKSLHTQTIKAENMASKLAQDDKQNDDAATIQELQRLHSQYDDLLTIYQGVEKQLAAACEDTNILIALRTATEGGDRASKLPRTPLPHRTKPSLISNSAESKRKKRKLDDTITSDAYSRTKMARSNSAAPGNPGGTPGAASGGGGNSFSGKDRDIGSGGSSIGGGGNDEPLARRNTKNKPHPPPSSTSVYDNYPTDPSDPSLLQLGREVAYRLPKQKTTEGEWIQCIIIEITGEGIKRRYSVQDPEPDEAGGHGQIYKASASALIPIPKESSGLPLYPVGKQVLARYPETTTFYRAEVMGTKRDGTCRLKFEGEEEVGKETEVERRLVLDFGGK